MTEDEAKTKWCPFVREVMDEDHVVANRDYYGGILARCIASDCMMWVETSSGKNLSRVQLHPAEGYCGLIKCS